MGPPLKVVHFDLSAHFGWLDRNVPFHLTKLLSPVPLFCILLTRTITKNAGWFGSGLCNRNVPFVGHVKFQKFQTGIFVEWKSPLEFPASY